jgi:uncharacterized protein
MTSPQAYPRPGAYINEQLLPLTQSSNNTPGQAVAAFANVANIGPEIPVFCSSWQSFVSNFGDFNLTAGNPLHFAVYSYFQNGGTGCFVMRVRTNSDSVVAGSTLVDTHGTPNTLFNVKAAQAQVQSHGAWGNNIFIEVVTLSSTTGSNVNLNIYYVPGNNLGLVVPPAGTPGPQFLVETFLNVSANPADPRYILNIVNSQVSGSQYITLSLNTAYDGTDNLAALSPTALTTGADGSTATTAANFMTAVETGFDNYCSGQILNMNIPGGWVTSGTTSMNQTSVINGLTTWAAGREDVFLLVDGPLPNFSGGPESSASVAAAYIAMLTSAIAPSSFNAIYGPYLLVQDPSSANIGATRYIGPSASLLGMWCQVDALVGVNQVAAGVQFGQMLCLGLEVYFTPTDLNSLFPTNINAIKKVPGYGFCAFGARTTLQGYPDMYIPIRRTLMKIEHDAIFLTQFALFQPNTPTLWANITTVLTNYLTTQTLNGLLASQNPATAFSVVCNGTNNSIASAQAGMVNISIAVALGSPVEIIVINISQLTTGAITNTNPSGSSQ